MFHLSNFIRNYYVETGWILEDSWCVENYRILPCNLSKRKYRNHEESTEQMSISQGFTSNVL